MAWHSFIHERGLCTLDPHRHKGPVLRQFIDLRSTPQGPHSKALGLRLKPKTPPSCSSLLTPLSAPIYLPSDESDCDHEVKCGESAPSQCDSESAHDLPRCRYCCCEITSSQCYACSGAPIAHDIGDFTFDAISAIQFKVYKYSYTPACVDLYAVKEADTVALEPVPSFSATHSEKLNEAPLAQSFPPQLNALLAECAHRNLSLASSLFSRFTKKLVPNSEIEVAPQVFQTTDGTAACLYNGI